MKLEVNKKHKKIDVSKIDFLKNRVFIPFLGLSISLSFFSGCSNQRNNEQVDELESTESYQNDEVVSIQELTIEDKTYEVTYQETTEPTETLVETISVVDEYGIVTIPELYRDGIAYEVDKTPGDDITVTDLEKIDELYLQIEEGYDLSWLKYCTNLKSLYLMSYVSYFNFDEKNCDFIKEMSNLDRLTLIGYQFIIQPGVIESFVNLKVLKLPDTSYDCDIDYSKLTFLDELYFSADPYSAVISFDSSDYNTLIDNGVDVFFSVFEEDNEEALDKFKNANKKLDEVIESFNLSEDASDQEKLDAILIYVLDNLQYDSEVSEVVENNMDYTEIASTFYIDGALHAFMEKDTAICGNYAALVDALANRLNLPSFVAVSDSHGWNIVCVEGENYYVDATWFDGAEMYRWDAVNDDITSIENAEEKIANAGKNSWYMVDPTEVNELDSKGHHDIINLPSYIIIRPIEDEEVIIETVPNETTMPTEVIETTIPSDSKDSQQTVEDITNKKFEISIGNKKWIICGAALVGIMSALGGAVAIRKKKKREEERRRKRRQSYNSYGMYGYSNSSLYGDDYSNGYPYSDDYPRRRGR